MAAIGVWTKASKNLWDKRLSKALRKAKGIQIHGVKEPDIENRRYCINQIKILQLNECYLDTEMELRKKSAAIINTENCEKVQGQSNILSIGNIEYGRLFYIKDFEKIIEQGNYSKDT